MAERTVRNLWMQTEYTFATWVADLDALRARPEELLEVVEAVVDAGARHQVWTPVELPVIGHRRGDDATLGERVRARWRGEQVVDLFAFTGAAMAPGVDGSSLAVAWD